METTFSHQIRVGIFTIVGIVAFCVAVILLGGDKYFFTRTYHLRIQMDQVQGLDRGSVVSLTGVNIGNVSEIAFMPNSTRVELTVTIHRSVQNRITEGSKASVKTQGALGDKYIFIEPGPVTNRPLDDNALIAVDRTPDLIDMIASKGAQLGEVVEVIKEVHTLFANINQDGHSAKLMKNLVEDSDKLGLFLTEGTEAFKLLRTDTLAPMASVMRKLDKGQGTLGALINDPALHNRIMGMLGEGPRSKFLKPLIRDSIETSEQKK